MNRNNLLGFGLAILIGTAGATSAAAGTHTPRLDRREAHQEQRIGAGLQNGQLTVREAARLQRAENRLYVNEARAKADGVVTPAERARLQAEANSNSRRIYRQKHDAQTRPRAWH